MFGEPGDSFNIADELGNLLRGGLVHPTGKPREPFDGGLFAHPPARPWRDPSARPAHGQHDVGAAHPVGSHRETQPRERRLHSRALEKIPSVAEVDRDAGLQERNLHWEQERVHSGEHRDLRGLRAGVEERSHVVGHVLDLIIDFRDSEGIGRAHVVRAGPDLLGHSHRVARQQVEGGRDHRRRTAVVDLERVMNGFGNVVLEAHEPLGRRAGKAVDGLVVVTDPEDRQRRPRQEPQQQHVGGREVLVLVDEQYLGTLLGGEPHPGIAQQNFDTEVDLFVEVDLTVLREVLAIVGEECREALEVAPIGVFHRLRRAQTEPNFGECVDPRRRRIGIGLARVLDVFGVGEDGANVAFVDRLQPGPAAHEPVGPVEDRQR